MTAPTEERDAQPVRGRHLGSRAHADGAGRQWRDVLAEHDVGPREAVEHAVGDHRLRPGAVLLGGLEHRDDRAAPLIGGGDQALERTEESGDVHVVPACVHHRNGQAVRIDAAGGAGVGEAGALLDGEAVHVGAEPHDGAAFALDGGVVVVADDRGEAGASDALLELDAEPVSRCAMTPAVRVSWNDSSG